jgi:hypothetical protein
MNWTFEKPKHGYLDDIHYLWIPVPKHLYKDIQEFVKTMDRPHDVTIKPHREKRTLEQNTYLWRLINELSNVLLISKEECYLRLLKQYSQVSVVSVLNEAVPMFTRTVKYYEITGEAVLNGKTFTHIKVYMGSSEMNTKEAWILTQGLIDECKEQGIETDTPEEIARLKALWEREK